MSSGLLLVISIGGGGCVGLLKYPIGAPEGVGPDGTDGPVEDIGGMNSFSAGGSAGGSTAGGSIAGGSTAGSAGGRPVTASSP